MERLDGVAFDVAGYPYRRNFVNNQETNVAEYTREPRRADRIDVSGVHETPERITVLC
jgi:hypothetical protein